MSNSFQGSLIPESRKKKRGEENFREIFVFIFFRPKFCIFVHFWKSFLEAVFPYNLASIGPHTSKAICDLVQETKTINLSNRSGGNYLFTVYSVFVIFVHTLLAGWLACLHFALFTFDQSNSSSWVENLGEPFQSLKRHGPIFKSFILQITYNYLCWDVAVVKWSACLPSTPMIQVQILLKPTVFSVKFMFEKKEYKQKRGHVGPFYKK